MRDHTGGPALGPVRPNPKGQKLLNLGDIKPGLRMQTWHSGRRTGIETVASLPFLAHQSDEIFSDDNGLWVMVETPYTYKGAGKRSLEDMCVVPYDHNGEWNQWNYVTKAEELKPVQFRRVTDSLDFFQQLDKWLKTIDNCDSDYRGEKTITVKIPEVLRYRINEHEATHTAGGGSWCGARRSVTVRFVHFA